MTEKIRRRVRRATLRRMEEAYRRDPMSIYPKELTMTQTKTRRPTQADRILRLLLDWGEAGVTRNDAVLVAGCHELSSRIGELERDGCIIDRRPWRGRNRFGDPVRGVAYVLTYVPRDRADQLRARERAEVNA